MARFRVNNLLEEVRNRLSGMPKTLDSIGGSIRGAMGGTDLARLSLSKPSMSNFRQNTNTIKKYGTTSFVQGNLPNTFQLGRGALQTGSLGLIDAPGYNPVTREQKLAKGIGNVTGFFGSPVARGLGTIGSAAIKNPVSRGIASRAAPYVTNNLARRVLPHVGAEMAESAAYLTGLSASRKAGLTNRPQDSFASDLAWGLGARGLLGGAGRIIKSMNPNIGNAARTKATYNPKNIDAEDMGLTDRLRDFWNSKNKDLEQVKTARDFTDKLASRYLDKKTIDNISQSTKNSQTYYKKLTDAIANKFRQSKADYGYAGNLALGIKANESGVQASKDNKAKVKLFISKQEKQQLADLGYSLDQIKKMKPQKAQEILKPTLKLKPSDRLPKDTPQARKDLADVMYETREQKLLKDKKTVDPFIKGLEDDMLKDSKAKAFNTKMQEVDEASGFRGQDEPNEELRRNDLGDLRKKVGIIDQLRTPDRVMEKIGLGEEAKFLRKQYDKYKQELPKEIDKITAWSKRVSPESNKRIFRYLDGEKISLSGEEKRVAKEIKSYLEEWANKLKLPEDKRVSDYITHIFEKGEIEKEFDPLLANLIDSKVAGSTYDPFLLKRQGAQNYIKDTWRALDAYVKRATRKYNMDPALQKIRARAGDSIDTTPLENSQYKYVKSYIDRINMRPTDIDTQIDNSFKQIFGYIAGQRPVAGATRAIRQMIYRGTLGLNPSSALKNISQGANTYAKLGEKHTVLGYLKLFQNFKGDELKKQGVLQDNFIQDRQLSSTKKLIEKLDKGLFFLFETAEKINRGAAYYGAKSKALSEGMNEKQAIDYAKKIVRDTQFTFGSIDTPPVLQSDIGKMLLQFQSFSLKQAEFLTEMAKKKEYAGIVRWLGSSLLFISTIGQMIGMDYSDLIPSMRIGGSPFFDLAKDTYSDFVIGKDKYGNELTTEQKMGNLGNNLVPFIPAGVAARRAIKGNIDLNRGYTTTRSGLVKTPLTDNAGNRIKASLFGSYNLPESKKYEKGQYLRSSQTEKFKTLPKDRQQEYYNSVMYNRSLEKNEQPTNTIKIKSSFLDTIKETLGLKGDVQAQNIDAKNINLPQTTQQLSVLYDDAQSVIDSYEDKKTKILYSNDPKYDYQIQRDVELQELEQEYNLAKQMVDNIEKERPEQVFEIQIETYKSEGGQSVESRAKWVAELLSSETDEQKQQDLINKLWDEKVITKGSSGVAAKLYEMGINVWGYTETGSIGGKGKKLTKLTIPKVNSIRLTPIKLSFVKPKAFKKSKKKLTLSNKSRTMRIKV